jgi:uncharacterized protein YlaN (UPF0358 family)
VSELCHCRQLLRVRMRNLSIPRCNDFKEVSVIVDERRIGLS